MCVLFSARGAEIMRYIHERQEWPTFQWDIAKLAEPLAAIRHKQGLLLGRMSALGFSIRAEAGLETLTLDVVKSSAIEGENLDTAQVRSSLARRLGIDIGGLTPVSRNVEGVVEMMLDATQRYAEPHKGTSVWLACGPFSYRIRSITAHHRGCLAQA